MLLEDSIARIGLAIEPCTLLADSATKPCMSPCATVPVCARASTWEESPRVPNSTRTKADALGESLGFV
jgi:hypothetical protein